MRVKLIGAGTDKLVFNTPMFIRSLEWSREDAKNDMALHKFTENALKHRGELKMRDYDKPDRERCF
jgi:hypothetical protein